jgi:hypothetical protein
VADPVIARLMTVRALLDLLGKADAGERAKLPLERAPFASASSSKSLWRLWLNSDYRGRSFYVYLPPKKSRPEQFRVHLRIIRWLWRIVGLDLPEDLKEHELAKLTQEP